MARCLYALLAVLLMSTASAMQSPGAGRPSTSVVTVGNMTATSVTSGGTTTTTITDRTSEVTTTTTTVKVPDAWPENKSGFVTEVNTTTTVKELPQAFGSIATVPASYNAAAYTASQQSNTQRSLGAVDWSSTLEGAREIAVKHQLPYAIYVCSDAAFPMSGEGQAARDAYKREHSGVAPQATIFDDAELLGKLNRAGLSVFVKIPKSQAFGLDVPANSLLVRAPNDEKLASLLGADCNADSAAALIASFPEKWKHWQSQQK